MTDFTQAQRDLLQRKFMAFQIAKNQVDEFVEYLHKEHNVHENIKIKNDLSGFDDPPKTNDGGQSDGNKDKL